MGEITAFVAGCLFSLLLTGGSLFLSYKVLQFREDTEVRRETKKRKAEHHAPRSGGVIKPKTFQEMEDEKNEELKAFNDLLNGP